MDERIKKAIAYNEKKRDAYQHLLDLLSSGDMEDLRVAIGRADVRNGFGRTLPDVLLFTAHSGRKERKVTVGSTQTVSIDVPNLAIGTHDGNANSALVRKGTNFQLGRDEYFFKTAKLPIVCGIFV